MFIEFKDWHRFDYWQKFKELLKMKICKNFEGFIIQFYYIIDTLLLLSFTCVFTKYFNNFISIIVRISNSYLSCKFSRIEIFSLIAFAITNFIQNLFPIFQEHFPVLTAIKFMTEKTNY